MDGGIIIAKDAEDDVTAAANAPGILIITNTFILNAQIVKR